MVKGFFCTLLICMLSFGVQAQVHKGISFQAIVKMPSGETPTRSGVSVKAVILSPNDCILREEQFSGVNVSNGYINLVLGTGAVGGSDPGFTLKQVMDNSGVITGLTCLFSDGSINSGVTSFNPAASNGARKFRMTMIMDSVPVVADFNMRAMAYALNAESLDGKTKFDLINVNVGQGLTQANAESIFNRYTKLDAILSNFNAGGSSLAGSVSGTASNVTGTVAIANGGTGATSAAGAKTNLGLAAIASSGSASDLSTGTVAPARLGTGTADNTTYLRGDGTWATPAGGGGGSGTVTSITPGTGLIHVTSPGNPLTTAGELAVNVGTGNNQIVQLTGTAKLPAVDGSNLTNVTASALSNTASINTSGNIVTSGNVQAGNSLTAKNIYVYDNAGTPASIGLKAPTDIVAAGGASYVLTLPEKKGTTGQVLAAKDGNGVLEWVSPAGGSVTAVTADVPVVINNSVAGSPKVTIPRANTTTSGYLDTADWNTFNNKQAAGNYITTLTGDVVSSLFVTGSVTTKVEKINGVAVAAALMTDDQKYLKYVDGAGWQAHFVKLSELRNSTGAASAFNVAGCTSAQTMVWSSLTDQFACQDITLPSGKVTGLATVATSGSYNDLSAKPTLGSLAAKSAVDLSTADASGVLPATKGGTGLSALGTSNQVLAVNAAGNALQYKSMPSCAANQYITFDGTNFTCVNDSGASGTVASISSGTAALTFSTPTGSITANIADATTAAKGLVQLAASGGTTAGTVVQATDARLTDGRAPSGTAGGDLDGTYPNPTLKTTAVTAASYGDATNVATFTVDSKGRLTNAAAVAIPTANTTTKGLLTAADWNTFNGKQAAGNYVTTLTGDVTSSGFSSGSVTTVVNNVVVDRISNEAGKYFTYQPNNTACGNNQVLKWANSRWECANDDNTATTYSAGTGLGLAGSTFSVTYGTTAGTAAQGNDSRITGAFQSSTSLGGDLTGTLPNPTVAKINGVAAAAAVAGDDLKFMKFVNGSGWQPHFVKLSELRNNLGTGSAFNVGGCTSAQTMVWSSLTDQFACQDITLPSGKVTGLATVATTGSYNDLADKPTLGSLAAKSAVDLATADVTGVLPVARGGTNSGTALNNNRVMVSSSGAIVENAAITASRAIASDANGLPVASATTSTELGYLSGVTSALQTQINGKASSSGWSNYSVIATNGSGSLTAVTGSLSGSVLQYSGTGPVYSSAAYPSSTSANQLLYSSSANVVGGLATANNAILTTDGSGVPSWSVVSNDVFTQYVRLVGRSGGQDVKGGTAASENLTLDSTNHATKGYVLLNPTGGNVGIGTTAPNVKLTVSGNSSSLPAPTTTGTIAQFASADGGNSRITIDAFAGVPVLDFRRAGTTAASPSAVQSGDNLGQLSWFGYGANAYSASARATIYVSAAENWTNTAMGTYMNFSTTPIGTTTPAVAMAISGSGYVGIGTTTPSNRFVMGDDIGATGTPSSTMAIGNVSGNSNLTIGQSNSTRGRVQWAYNATTTSAYMSVGALSSANALVLQDQGGNVGVGIAAPTAKLDVNGVINVNNNKITNVATPTAATDVATKAYVDAAMSGSGVSMISAESASTYSYANALAYCRSLNDVCQYNSDGSACGATTYTGWRLPKAEELSSFAGLTASTSYLLTTTTSSASGADYYIIIKINDGAWTGSLVSTARKVRCVR